MWAYVQPTIEFLQKYPEILAILCATFGSWALGALSEYFMPATWPDRAQKQITLLINVCSGTILCAVIWFGLDHVDARGLRLAVSLVCGVTSPFSYMLVGRILAHYFPWATAWAPK
jgi:hypothetical protein